jgi:mannose-6-phosphate isomerase-like protein (cupin superfamily)
VRIVHAAPTDQVTDTLREHQLSNVGRGPLTFFVVASPNVTGDAEKR